MTRTLLYLDPWAGVSGDMLLGALLDIDREDGDLDRELLRTVVALGLEEAAVDITRDVEWGVACTRVRVRDESHAPFRSLAEVERMIDSGSLPATVRARALEAVRRLAAVEATVHECGVEEIHFHEVGAMDTLVDVVGVFALTEALGVDDVGVGVIPIGGGTVEVMHGRMGVPAPATALLLEGYEIVGGPEMRELTTPTGALLVRQLHAEGGVLPEMRAERVGYGAGDLKLEHGPNLLRVVLGKTVGAEKTDVGEHEEVALGQDVVVELQTNLDDVSAEVIGHALQSLRETGALDAWTVPAYMKKGRSGVVVHALVKLADEAAATAVLFDQTGTLGIRRQVVSRRLAARGHVSVTLEGMPVRVKWGRWRGRLISLAPEYEDAAAVAAQGSPLKDVMQQAVEAARELLDP